MKYKKLKIVLLLLAVIIIAFAGASFYGAKKAHQWFQSDQFELYLQAKLKQHGNAHLAFGSRSLKIFPRPQVVVEDVDIILFGNQKISVQNLSFAIDLRSLWEGVPVIDTIRLENPVLTLNLPAFALKGDDTPFPDITLLLRQYLQMAQSSVEIDTLIIEDGQAVVNFADAYLPQVNLSKVNFEADVKLNRLNLSLNLKDDFLEELSFKGAADFNKGTFKGVGIITAAQLGPFFPPKLFYKESVDITHCLISGRFNLEIDEAVKLSLTGLDLSGRITDGVDEVFPVLAKSQLTLTAQNQTLRVATGGLNGLWPRGRYVADISFNLADLSKPHTIIDFNGYNINIAEAGGFLGILDENAEHLFTNIVQDGLAQKVSFYANADNFDDIFDYRFFEMDFEISDGTIYIFPIRLKLEKVNGAGMLKDGFVTLNDAVGGWRATTAANCDLKLDLNTNDYDFAFSSKLDFDASGLQDLLRLINPKFTNQLLDRLENLDGRVPVDLDVKYNKGQEVITVISETFNATGVYKVGQLPVTIKNGKFTYADTSHMEFTSPDTSLGDSRAYNVTYMQDLSPAAVAANNTKSTITATEVDVNLTESLPAIMELAGENTPRFLYQWQFTSGELILRDFRLNGLLDDYDTWLIDAGVTATDMRAFNKNFAEEPFTSPNVTATIKTNGDLVNFSDINAAFLFAKDNEVNVKGGATANGGDIALDLDISAPKIDFDLLLKVIEGPENAPVNDQFDNVTGKISFTADTATLFQRAWAPVKASITISPEKGYMIDLDDVALCNIALKGRINLNKDQIDMRVEPWLTDGDMSMVLPCLSKNLTMAEGDISIQGFVTAKGNVKQLKQLLNGEFQLYSDKGRILKFTLLANLLSIINVTEFYKGTLPNFNDEGFDYSELLLKGKIVNGNIIIEDTTIDSSFFTAVASGSIDVAQNHVSMDILVAPFKTVDRLISYIPIIGHIMGNNLVALPFRAVGPIENPSIIPLPPDAVASSLLGVLGRTITSPVSIFDNALFDMFSGESHTEKNPNKQPGAAPPTGDIDTDNPSGQNESTAPPVHNENLKQNNGRNGNGQNQKTDDGFKTTFYGPEGN